MNRAAFYAALSAKTLKGLIIDATAAGGNAATRLERSLVDLDYGHYADLDALMEKQRVELDPKKREAILHEIQKLVYDRYMYIILHGSSSPNGMGPRVKEPAIDTPIVFFSCPYEDMEIYPE
jgi:ABC-type transport system substrate-binding protein